MKRYQGEDIAFTLTLRPRGVNEMQNFFEAEQVTVYLYTNTLHIAKFGMTIDYTDYGYGDVELETYRINDDYQELEAEIRKKRNIETGEFIGYLLTKISGTLKSADTKLMRGTLYADIHIRYANGETDNIKSVNTGVEICDTPIKVEAQ